MFSNIIVSIECLFVHFNLHKPTRGINSYALLINRYPGGQDSNTEIKQLKTQK